jgi:dTDP-4-amino-4,6-dideoxygalactose transaminase
VTPAAKPILTGDPGASYRAYASEIDAAVKAVFDSGWYILGEFTKTFERDYAAWNDVKRLAGVASGTDAICLGLRAIGVAPGDEVITVSHTAVATVAAIEAIGAVPVLADIDPDTYTLDPEAAAAMITARTRAIMPVHIYGHPADMAGLIRLAREGGLPLVEDCAQAHGATHDGRRVGSIGKIGCFSFYPTKNLGAIGDGGGVATSDQSVSDALDLLRQYGWDKPQHSIRAGVCSRLDEVQSAILSVKLRHLDSEIARRQAIAARLDAALSGLPLKLPAVKAGATHAYHLYVVQTDRRDELRAHLQKLGIVAGIHYPQPVHVQPAYKGRVRHDAMVVTEAISPRILSLPLHPQMNDAMVDFVAEGVATFFGRHMR